MVGVEAPTLPDSSISPQKARQNPGPAHATPLNPSLKLKPKPLGYLRFIRSSRNCHQGGATLRLTSWCW